MGKQLTSKEWQEKRDKYVVKGVSNGNRAIAVKGKGATLYDLEGKKFIDFGAAIGTINVGHSHPKVVAAIQEQAEKVIHPGFNVVMYPSYIEICEKLCVVSPGNFAKKAILLNSGAEAVENAVKIARKYTKRQAVVTFTRGFHGRTLMTMTMTSKVKPYKLGFGPFAPEVYQAPYPYMYRKPDGMTDEQYEADVIAQFDQFFVATVAPETVACIVMEPIQGEGGFVIPPKSFVKHVREFCSKHGILMVADEIQTGFARTGKLFAMEHFDIAADLMTASKSIAGGMPLSAVIGKAEIMDMADPGELGGTYCGNPLACEAALAVLEVIEEEQLCEKAKWIGEMLEGQVKKWQEKYNFIGEFRGLGAMCAVEIVTDQKSKTPNKELTTKIAKAANEAGLLLLTAGLDGNIIRFLSPLVITEEELSEGLTILENVLENVLAYS